MEYIVIGIVAFVASLLTFFSGFGLGTILTPVFVFFFPVEVAIALTGVVHFLNNIFKLFLIGFKANKKVLIRFGIPAVIAAFAGATLLINLTDIQPLYSYTFGGKLYEVTALKGVIAILLFGFAVLDLLPASKSWAFNENKLPLGGLLSGFFGGLSGHQGALRSAFLVKSGLSKEAFIATSVIIASCVDFTRLSVYSARFINSDLQNYLPLLTGAGLAAFAGALAGRQLLKKITLDLIHKLVAVMLMLISIGLGAGLI